MSITMPDVQDGMCCAHPMSQHDANGCTQCDCGMPGEDPAEEQSESAAVEADEQKKGQS